MDNLTFKKDVDGTLKGIYYELVSMKIPVKFEVEIKKLQKLGYIFILKDLGSDFKYLSHLRDKFFKTQTDAAFEAGKTLETIMLKYRDNYNKKGVCTDERKIHILRHKNERL